MTNASSGEPVVPATGRRAAVTLHAVDAPQDLSLNWLEVLFDGEAGNVTYVGSGSSGDVTQINVLLPDGIRTGLVPIEVRWRGGRLCANAVIRVIPAGPTVPSLIAVSDGVNLGSRQRVESGSMKTVIEGDSAVAFAALIDEIPVEEMTSLCVDPLADSHEINFRIPDRIAGGQHRLKMLLGTKILAEFDIEVIRK